MLLVRNAAVLVPSFLLSSCVFMGPRDGVVVITGNAPTSETSRCTVALRAIGVKVRPQERPVEGIFSETFVINPNRRGHSASLQCGGVGLIAERTFKYGRDVDIGGVVPLDGHAP